MKKIFWLLIMASCFAGCAKDPECNYDQCAMKAPASEIQTLRDYLQANSITATEHCSGIFYTIQQPGNGAAPSACGGVSVTYEGRLSDGTVFDRTQPGQQANFGLGGLITGFKNGVLQIKSGGRITIYIPPSLGYGSQPQTGIPANSILVFTVELLAVQ